jgi:hypothetical protein
MGSIAKSSPHCVHVIQSTEIHSPVPRVPRVFSSQPWMNVTSDDSAPDSQGTNTEEPFPTLFPINLSNEDTRALRISLLSADERGILNSCGQDVSTQEAVLAILESEGYREKKCIGYELAMPLLQRIEYTRSNGRDGKRGAPEKYRCRWHGCTWENRRKLRGLEHIRSHVKNRPFICPQW